MLFVSHLSLFPYIALHKYAMYVSCSLHIANTEVCQLPGKKTYTVITSSLILFKFQSSTSVGYGGGRVPASREARPE